MSMTPETVLEFWFGAEADDATVAERQANLWWGKSIRTDEEIRSRFAEIVSKAGRGELVDWEKSSRGGLAVILITDQFPRCIYRNSPQAFAYDGKALSLCLRGLRLGLDAPLRLIERVFFYLPLEHSEAFEHQEKSVELFRGLLEEAKATHPSEATAKVFQGFLDFAVRHREIIARFGRFPHRNDLLGRSSTPEELAFLEEPGSSF